MNKSNQNVQCENVGKKSPVFQFKKNGIEKEQKRNGAEC